ncbi:MAG TPA: DUF418 domain-containing protein [Thermoanaerobaculia bacterium]|nr:DUF418 domain-containing protein [Thermoanaerobaculia bacterium]
MHVDEPDRGYPTVADPAPAAAGEGLPLDAPALPVPLAPTTAAERIETIDILRGLALFGIIAANMRGFAAPSHVYFETHLMWTGLADRVAQAFIEIFIQGKFITIFAFLFGVGFGVQLSRAEERGAKFGGVYTRRLLVLIGFGLVHGLLIWWGDILLPYALTGFLLLLFWKRADRTLFGWAVVAYLVPLALIGVAVIVPMLIGQPSDGPPPVTPETLQQTIAAYGEGSWIYVQRIRTTEALTMNWGYFFFMFMQLLALFLAGVLAWRRRLLLPPVESLPAYRKAMRWGFGVGLAGNGAVAVIDWIEPLTFFPPSPRLLLVTAIQTVAIPALSTAYVCAVILVCRDEAWRARLRGFGAVGRTALSNYLLQSVICTLIFYSYGMGLYGEVGPALLLIPTLMIYAAEVWVSGWWLARFRFGPAEWLWRSLTYGTRQPMRRAVSAGVEEAAARS